MCTISPGSPLPHVGPGGDVAAASVAGGDDAVGLGATLGHAGWAAGTRLVPPGHLHPSALQQLIDGGREGLPVETRALKKGDDAHRPAVPVQLAEQGDRVVGEARDLPFVVRHADNGSSPAPGGDKPRFCHRLEGPLLAQILAAGIGAAIHNVYGFTMTQPAKYAVIRVPRR